MASAANTPMRINIDNTMTTSTYPELTAFQLLYDYMRVTGGKLWYRFSTGTAGTFSSVSCSAAVNSDVNTATSSLSLSDTLSSRFHGPPIMMYPTVVGPTTQSNSFYKIPFSTDAPCVPINASDAVGGSWFMTASASTPVINCAHFFAEAAGGTGTVNVTFLWELFVEFRLRD